MTRVRELRPNFDEVFVTLMEQSDVQSVEERALRPALRRREELMALGASSNQAPEPPSIPDTDRGAFGSVLGTTATTAAGPSGERVSSFSLSAWAVARYTLVIAFSLAGLVLLWKIQEVLLLLLLAIIFATALGAAAGVLRYSPWKFLAACFLGKAAKFLIAALIGQQAHAFGWLE